MSAGRRANRSTLAGGRHRNSYTMILYIYEHPHNMYMCPLHAHEYHYRGPLSRAQPGAARRVKTRRPTSRLTGG